MKKAIAYKKRDGLYLHSSSRTTAGVWIATLPFVKIELDSNAWAKGEVVLQVLAASHDGVAHPTSWGRLIDPLLELAGVKSWSTFMKNATCVELESEEVGLKLIPTRNLGPTDGFEAILGSAVEMSIESPAEQIGVILETLLT